MLYCSCKTNKRKREKAAHRTKVCIIISTKLVICISIFQLRTPGTVAVTNVEFVTPFLTAENFSDVML